MKNAHREGAGAAGGVEDLCTVYCINKYVNLFRIELVRLIGIGKEVVETFLAPNLTLPRQGGGNRVCR